MGIRFILRLSLGIVIGLSVVGTFMLIVSFTEGIDPQDFWTVASIAGFIGAMVGAIVGIAWGIIAESPSSEGVKPQPLTPDDTPESN
jgi:hypothetical protein